MKFTYQHNNVIKKTSHAVYGVFLSNHGIYFFSEILMTVNWLSLFCNDLRPLFIYFGM